LVKRLLTAFARSLVAAELAIVLLIAPALLFPSPRRMLALAVVPLIWFAAHVHTGRWVPRTPLNSVLVVLLAMAGVSLWATYDPLASLGKVAGVLLGVWLVWAVVRWITTPWRLDVSVAVFLAAGAGLAVIGLLGTNWFSKFPVFGVVIDRLPKAIRGLPGAEEGFHPNLVAGCLVLFVPLQLSLTWRALTTWRTSPSAERGRWLARFAGHAGLLLLTGGTLLLTQSRGAWTGMAAAGLAFCAWHSRLTRRIAGGLLLAGVLAVLAVGPSRVANLAISRSGPGMAGNVEGRMELWSRAIYGIQDFPITGMGMNTFRKIMPVLYPTFLTSPDFDVAHAHNHLLQAALDLGLPGLVAYTALWLLLAVMLMRVYRGAADARVRVVAGGLGAGLIAHFSFGMTDAVALGAKAGVLFWLAVALVTALHQIWPLPQTLDSNNHSFARR
jgi:putative inorganic carbon (HCO3(-)) transporter